MSLWIGVSAGSALCQLGFLGAAFAAVGEQIPGIARRHQPRARERQRDAAGVDRDPAPAPLLGDIGGGARAAGRIEHEVAGVGGHQDAAFDDPWLSLNNVDLIVAELQLSRVVPDIVQAAHRKIIEKPDVRKRITHKLKPLGLLKTLHSDFVRLPARALRRT